MMEQTFTKMSFAEFAARYPEATKEWSLTAEKHAEHEADGILIGTARVMCYGRLPVMTDADGTDDRIFNVFVLGRWTRASDVLAMSLMDLARGAAALGFIKESFAVAARRAFDAQ